MVLPTDELIRFIVCDSAREEKYNKISLLGVYADSKVLLPADARFPAAFPLTLVYFLLDGEGPFDAAIEVKPPSPHAPFHAPMPNIKKPVDEAGTVLVAFTPFTANAFGAFEATLILNNQKYTRTFQVAAAPKSV